MKEDTTKLPALVIEVSGELAVTSNLAEFQTAAAAWIATIKTDLKTDEDFGQAEDDVKQLKASEDRIAQMIAEALEKAGAVNELLEALGGVSGEIRDARLNLSRQVKAQKDGLKSRLVSEALAEIDSDNRKSFLLTLEEAAKGKRTVSTMQAALEKEVIIANANIATCRATLDVFEEGYGTAMTQDRRHLETMHPDALDTELQRRSDVAAAQEEARAAKAAAEEERKKTSDAQKALAEKDKPPVPTETSGDEDQLEASGQEGEWQEWQAFLKSAFERLSGLKSLRDALTFPENINRAQELADGFNAAWKKAISQ